MLAAMRRAFSCTFRVAFRIAVPPTATLRLPPVPLPIWTAAVSP